MIGNRAILYYRQDAKNAKLREFSTLKARLYCRKIRDTVRDKSISSFATLCLGHEISKTVFLSDLGALGVLAVKIVLIGCTLNLQTPQSFLPIRA
jgi:hypothetical protein